MYENHSRCLKLIIAELRNSIITNLTARLNLCMYFIYILYSPRVLILDNIIHYITFILGYTFIIENSRSQETSSLGKIRYILQTLNCLRINYENFKDN